MPERPKQRDRDEVDTTRTTEQRRRRKKDQGSEE